ncbi:MAG TPA: OmpA family protein [Gammaproteobacteria bacterium]|nr:OmpA family protein [Gammaproteobacteria bacterium]
MKRTTQVLVLAGLGMASGFTFAAPGYVSNNTGTMTRTGYGDCLHTNRWSIPNAIAECDPEIVAQRDGINVAAVEVVVQTEKPIHLEADTLFGFDSAKLTGDGKALLDDLLQNLTAATLKEEKIQVRGYTDRIGDDEYNLRLSKRRAAAVRDYLVSKGVVPTFIEMEGFGEADPIVDCKGVRGARLIDCLAPNRRAEIEISAMEVVDTDVKEETKPIPMKEPAK